MVFPHCGICQVMRWRRGHGTVQGTLPPFTLQMHLALQTNNTPATAVQVNKCRTAEHFKTHRKALNHKVRCSPKLSFLKTMSRDCQDCKDWNKSLICCKLVSQITQYNRKSYPTAMHNCTVPGCKELASHSHGHQNRNLSAWLLSTQQSANVIFRLRNLLSLLLSWETGNCIAHKPQN